MRKASRQPSRAREQIEQTAYRLFTRHGIRAVGVDAIVAESGVAKMTLYRHYPSKDELALAFLRQRWERFSRGWQREVERLGLPPAEALLGVFDVLDKWYRSRDYAGCPVVKTVLQFKGRGSPVRNAALRHFDRVRGFMQELAANAGARDAEGLARQWHLLVFGSIIVASAGDRDAAQKAKQLGLVLLTHQGIAPAPRKPRRGQGYALARLRHARRAKKG